MALNAIVAAVAADAPLPTTGLVSFWDFREPAGDFVASLGRGRYRLEEQSFDPRTRVWSSGNAVARVPGGPFGRCADLARSQMLRVRDTSRAAPYLDIRGDNATLTVVRPPHPTHRLSLTARRWRG